MNNITAVIDNFLFHSKFEKNLSAKTIKSYKTDLEQFQSFLTKRSFEGDFTSIDKLILKDYIRSLANFKPKTIKRKIASVKALFNHFEFENDDFNNPIRKIRTNIKEPFVLPVVMNLGEVKKIFRTAYREREKINDKMSYSYKEKTRDIAILETLFATGVRVSEICELSPKDIDLKSGVLVITGKGQKERIIQICNQETTFVLKEYFNLFKEQIKEKEFFFINRFGNPLSSQSVRNMIRKYTGSVKISKNITPHTFRHTFATLLLEQGVDIKYIQHLLGHSSILTTQIYTHVNHKKQKKILTAKHPRKHFTCYDF